MKGRRSSRLGVTLLLAVVAALFLLPAARGARAAATLSDADCVKCHDRQPAEIDANGKAHKTAVTCQSCHESHRPKVANNIPACGMCHDGKPHYKLEGCKTCHNPHMPLEITLKGELKEVCLTCHGTQGQQLTANPSKHTNVACNFCHAEKHGVIPQCVQCHTPHSNDMTQADCGNCHKAHMPLVVAYGPKTPSVQCSACHADAYAQLQASKAKHHNLACVYCHAEKHKTVPKCSDCHGTPHAPGMHQRFPKCGDCHKTAHDLNNWSEVKGPSGEKK